MNNFISKLIQRLKSVAFGRRDKGRYVLRQTINLCIAIIRMHGNNLGTNSPEERQKLYLFSGLAHLVDLGSSLSYEKFETGASLSMRSLFETFVKCINLIYDPEFIERFEYFGLKEQVGMNTYLAENHERYGELLNQIDSWDNTSLQEAYENKKEEKLEPLLMNKLTDSAAKYLKDAEPGSAEFAHFYNDVYKLISNYSAHFNPGVVSAYVDVRAEHMAISKYLAPIDATLYKIATGMIIIFISHLDDNYSLGMTEKIEGLNELLLKL